ncbi:unnamed protein product, partial [Prorocentrum cordatum]
GCATPFTDAGQGKFNASYVKILYCKFWQLEGCIHTALNPTVDTTAEARAITLDGGAVAAEQVIAAAGLFGQWAARELGAIAEEQAREEVEDLVARGGNAETSRFRPPRRPSARLAALGLVLRLSDSSEITLNLLATELLTAAQNARRPQDWTWRPMDLCCWLLLLSQVEMAAATCNAHRAYPMAGLSEGNCRARNFWGQVNDGPEAILRKLLDDNELYLSSSFFEHEGGHAHVATAETMSRLDRVITNVVLHEATQAYWIDYESDSRFDSEDHFPVYSKLQYASSKARSAAPAGQLSATTLISYAGNARLNYVIDQGLASLLERSLALLRCCEIRALGQFVTCLWILSSLVSDPWPFAEPRALPGARAGLPTAPTD